MIELENRISEIELVYRKVVKSDSLLQISSSSDANAILRKIWSNRIELCEEFIVVLLNNANKCLGWVKISQGGMTGTVVENKLILATALKTAATGVLIAHNHPSGNILPSTADISITQRLDNCCKMFDIKLIDHLILSGDTDNYYSFKDEGKI
ncbi:MAG: repair protein [Bacteroidota bacterium]|jgi:DNA repair protein RadC|nr:repair protein [Bacteroidota bacterium]